MRIDEFNRREIKNKIGGRHNTDNEYNVLRKNMQRSKPLQFSNIKAKERVKILEMRDLRARRLAKEKSIINKAKRNKELLKAKNIKKQLLKQVIGMVMGSVIVVNSYITMTDARKAEAKDRSANAGTNVDFNDTGDNAEENSGISIQWKWSDDYKKADMIINKDSGTEEIAAKITAKVKEATCVKTGEIIYTAKAEYDGKSYTDKKMEILEATGHSFGEGKTISNEDGSIIMDYECNNCHKHFSIDISVEEQ
ncbi:MAG: hypothetical protein K6G26_05645 [Lachnospiraceae bacterium]|nr:hypothetical protein [Lachnospiraceae bacterium]